MTASTGKRSSRACLRCRKRKTRCDLDTIGEPGKAPCVFRHDTKSQCVLIKSRRGGNFRQHQHKSGTSRRQKTPLPTNSGDSNGPDVEPANSVSDVTESSSNGEDSVGRQNPGDVLAMELRNPSDALQILAMSGQVRSGSRLQAQFTSTANLEEQLDAAAHRTSASDTNHSQDSQSHQRPSATMFDDYDLLSSPLRRETIPTIHSPIVIAGITPNVSWLMYSWHTPGPKRQQLSRDCYFWRSGFPIFKFKKHHLNRPKICLAKIEQLGRLLGSQSGKAISSASTRPPFVVLVTVGQSNEQSKTGLSGHISVRLGQSFWSRGPSLAAKFTADDFPSLQPRPENDNEDYASWLQASMELIQNLHNAHAILYSSKDRTLAMVYEGDYARYLDDFRTSATTWRSAWGNLAVSAKIRTTLLIMYEYICLYTNAFSFQAVLTRASRPYGSSNKGQQSERPFADILSKGIMASPDGRYGVYAAVLLHKADRAGAFQSEEQNQEITNLAQKFISVLEKGASTESHICHSYSRMLRQLWSRREKKNTKASRSQDNIELNLGDQHNLSTPPQSFLLAQEPDNQTFADGTLGDACISQQISPLPMENDVSEFPSVEGYFLGSFMPGIADFSTPNFDEYLAQEYTLIGGADGPQNWNSVDPNVDSHILDL
ncbi:C6 transcription factor [Aspergillus luchuensis]|uniref:C6 transcription factor n=1 Tax=Aspergillus kawachii TaxID=1069201 RepID=A0A146F9C4_ASPKA|nr:C6 transcription factor [Aspergillus luchuensis]